MRVSHVAHFSECHSDSPIDHRVQLHILPGLCRALPSPPLSSGDECLPVTDKTSIFNYSPVIISFIEADTVPYA